MEFAGGDGTSMFEDVGHSSEARSTMKDFLIGSVKVRDSGIVLYVIHSSHPLMCFF